MNNQIAAYNLLKTMSFEEVVLMIMKNNNLDVTPDVNIEKDTYYTAKQLINLYPNIFSKYKLAKYIKEDNLPFFKDGKERIFLKSNIEKWLENKNNQAMFRSI